MNTLRESAPYQLRLRALFTRLIVGAAAGCASSVTPVEADVVVVDAPLTDVAEAAVDASEVFCSTFDTQQGCFNGSITVHNSECKVHGPLPEADGGALEAAQSLCSAACAVGRAPSWNCTETAGVWDCVACIDCIICGRRAPGTPVLEPEGSGPGALLARMAWLEAESVHAFEQLARELAAFGAPAAWVGAFAAAAEDERQHTRLVGTLARGCGATVSEVREGDTAPRTRWEVALDNAREGCARETFGALVATFQADHAPDANTRALFGRIAADETRHAALAWALHAWLRAGLTETERHAVDAALERALTELACVPELPVSGADALGLPGGPWLRALAGGFAREVRAWGATADA